MSLNLKNNVTSLRKSKKKPLSKELGNFAAIGNPMRNADLQGTYNEQKRRAYNHYIESQTDYDGNGGVSTYNMTEYLKANKAQKQVKKLEKTAKKRGYTLR